LEMGVANLEMVMANKVVVIARRRKGVARRGMIPYCKWCSGVPQI
jgi:hypothetical protein